MEKGEALCAAQQHLYQGPAVWIMTVLEDDDRAERIPPPSDLATAITAQCYVIHMFVVRLS